MMEKDAEFLEQAFEDEDEVEDEDEDEVEDEDKAEDADLSLQEKIEELNLHLKVCPNDYKSRMELIGLLRNDGELDALREQRKTISKIFTMPPKFWLDWISDEMSCEESGVDQLFESAAKDFLSPDIYIEYVQYACGISIEFARKKLEESVNMLGMRPDCAFLIWNIWLDFEKTILSSLSGEEAEKQRKRIECLYEKALSSPYKSIDEMWKEYLVFVDEAQSEIAKSNYERSLKKMPEVTKMEDELDSASDLDEKLSVFEKWIDKKSAGNKYNPSEIQMIYERALTESAEEPSCSIWLSYGCWLDYKLKDRSVAVKVYERGVRHVANSMLWQQYFAALERLAVDLSVIEEKLPQALETPICVEDGMALYRTYLYVLLRYAKNQACDMSKVTAAFEKGSRILKEKFGAYWDSRGAVYRRNYAHFLFTVVKDIDHARRVWNDILASGSGRLAQMWLEAVKYERFFGEIPIARKLLYKAINSVNDNVSQVYEALLQFEREEGTVEDMDKAVEKIHSQTMRRSQQGRVEDSHKPSRKRRTNDETEIFHPTPPKKRNQGEKRPYNLNEGHSRKNDEKSVAPKKNFVQPLIVDEDGFAVPSLPSVSSKKDSRLDFNNTEKAADNASQSAAEKEKFVSTIFISNMDFKLSKEEIEKIFPEAKEIRLVYRGMSKIHKGFGYVDFESAEHAKDALSKDRTLVNGRPIYVSEYKPNEKGETKQFRFSTNREKNKIFVKNVHYDASEEQLRQIFSKYGTIVDIRMVVHKSGKSKGCAYIEFEADENASAAVNGDEVYLLERKLSVAISDPPKKSSEEKFDVASKQHQRNRLDFVPRSVSKPVEQSKTSVGKPMSNEQFRSFLKR